MDNWRRNVQAKFNRKQFTILSILYLPEAHRHITQPISGTHKRKHRPWRYGSELGSQTIYVCNEVQNQIKGNTQLPLIKTTKIRKQAKNIESIKPTTDRKKEKQFWVVAHLDGRIA